MFSNRSNPPLCQVSMFNTSPISRKCDITVRTCKLLRHIIPLEEIDRNCLQLSYALFFGLIHISLTFSERDVGTALSYRDKNHFGASISRKTNFKSSIWKWQRRHFRKLLEVARFSLRDVTMAKIVRTNKLPSSPPPPAAGWKNDGSQEIAPAITVNSAHCKIEVSGHLCVITLIRARSLVSNTRVFTIHHALCVPKWFVRRESGHCYWRWNRHRKSNS